MVGGSTMREFLRDDERQDFPPQIWHCRCATYIENKKKKMNSILYEQINLWLYKIQIIEKNKKINKNHKFWCTLIKNKVKKKNTKFNHGTQLEGQKKKLACV